MPVYKESEHPRNKNGEYRNKNGVTQPGQLPTDDADNNESELTKYAFTNLNGDWLEDDDPRLDSCHEVANAIQEESANWPQAKLEVGEYGNVYITNKNDLDVRAEISMGEEQDGLVVKTSQQRIGSDGEWHYTGWNASSTPGKLTGEMDTNIRTAYHQACKPENYPSTIAPSSVSDGYMGSSAITGGKYNPRMTSAEKTKAMREDFKQLKKRGEIPKDWKISVRKSSFAGGWSANINVKLPEGVHRYYVPSSDEYYESLKDNKGYDNPNRKAVRGLCELNGGSIGPDEWKTVADRINQKISNGEELDYKEWDCVVETPQVRKVRKLCKQVANQYTYSNVNSMVDYFEVDGYVNVSVTEAGSEY